VAPLICIRKATHQDFERIVELEDACFKGPLAYSRRQLWYLLTKANSTVLVESAAGIIRGFIIVLYKKGTHVAGIETINVDPSYRKLGVGTQLFTAAEQDMRKKKIKKIRLEVSTSNHAAIALYEHAGFKKTTLLKNYYIYNHSGSRDAMRMIKELP
jgi:ribosomal protein S18 acetylase RimI-like enzyme